MLKFTFMILILGGAIVFLVGMVTIIRTAESIPATIDKKGQERKEQDKALSEWANSPTPGYDGGKK